ncbi:hypothetical protein [Micromonospora sp. CB01531]|uniref:hypothetical protein n=1 Tax=Micromonospora sp. CB01531 TaxID=1718947 RepID=UPI00093DCC8E|nr:hypothetical protein [Micromonospora sp. CB01531]OKI52842.1 hypothetical protein A6A27_08085 [Micromonospora sp. CB01531]
MFTLAAAQEPHRGWGGPVALLIAVAVFITIATLHDVWMRRGLPSPTEGDDTEDGVTAQVSKVSDTDDTDRDTNWWGRIVEHGGRRVRVDGPPRDEALDLELDDEEPAETLEEAVDRMDRQGVPYAEIVRRVMADHQVSESTAKRAIRRSREARSPA